MLRVYSVMYLQNLWVQPSCTTSPDPVQPVVSLPAKDTNMGEPVEDTEVPTEAEDSDSATHTPYRLDAETVSNRPEHLPPPLKTTMEEVEEDEAEDKSEDQKVPPLAPISEEPREDRRERSFSIVSSLAASMPPTPTSLRSPLKKGEAVLRRGSIRLTEKKKHLTTKLKRAFSKNQAL